MNSSFTAATDQRRSHAALPYFLEALRAIPQHEKLEYRHALRVAPHLVEKESDPVAFLRFCNWDAKAAARRLTVYWRKRKEVFGETRAFLPLLDDFSGNGALSRDEVEVLQSGAVCLLAKDRHSRDVIYFDRHQLPPAFREKGDVKMRAFFWAVNQASRNTLSQTTGCVIIASRNMARDLTQADYNNQAAFVKVLREAFPLRCQKLHIVVLVQERPPLQSVVMPYLLHNLWRFFCGVAIHNCASKEQVVSEFERHGIPRESLPRRIGGLAETDLPSLLSTNHGVNAASVAAVEGFAQGGSTESCQFNELSDLEVESNFVDSDCDKGGDDCWNGAIENEDPFSDMLDSISLESDGSPFEPIPIQTPSPPGQMQHDNSDGALHDMGSVLFSEHMLNMVAVDSEGSPFNPRPIRSPPPQQQQRVATHSSLPTSAVNKDALRLDIVLKRNLATLNEALSCLAAVDRVAYEEALRKAPAVVHTESDPVSYLLLEKFDAWAAAKRLALYWTYRVQYFGDRAFLPLNQTMGGALWEEDIGTLASGAMFLLPSDSRGRPVLCFNPSKRPDGVSKASLIRVAFYFFSIVCCEYPITMTEGCMIMVFASTGVMELSKLNNDTREATDMALDSFPTTTFETHVIYSQPPTANPLVSFGSIVAPKLLYLLGRLLSHDRVHFYVEETRDELLHKLASCGLSGEAFQAAVLNGGISDDDFAQWMKNRRLLESTNYMHNQRQQKQPRTTAAGSTSVTISNPGRHRGPLHS